MIETQNLDYERATKDPDTNIYKHDYSDSKASRKSFVGKVRSRFRRNQREAKELEKIRTTTGLSDPTPEFDSRDFFDDGLTYKERLKRSTPVLGAVALVGAALFVSTEKSHVLYNDDNPNGVGISGLNIDGLNISEWGWDGVDINPNGNFGGFFTAGDDYEPTQTPPAYATPIVSTEPSSSPAEQIGTPEVTTKPTTEPTNEAEPTAQPTQTPVPPTEIPVVESSGNSVNTHDNEPENDGGFDESVYETFPEDVTNPKIDESTATVDTDKPSRDEAQDETEVMESEEDDELSPEMIIIPHEGSITGTFQSYVFQKYNIVLDADESYIMYEDIFTPEIFDEVEFYRLNNGDQGIKDSGPAIITVKGQEIIETWLIEQGYLTKE